MKTETMTREKQLAIGRKEMTRKINAASAMAILNGLLGGSGLKYRLCCQKYRVKVLVQLERQSAVLLIFYYKDLLNKDLSALAATLCTLNSMVAPEKKRRIRD